MNFWQNLTFRDCAQKCFYRIFSLKINPALDMRLIFSLISFDNGTLVLLTGKFLVEMNNSKRLSISLIISLFVHFSTAVEIFKKYSIQKGSIQR